MIVSLFINMAFWWLILPGNPGAAGETAAKTWLMLTPFVINIWMLRKKNRSWAWSLFGLWTLCWVPLLLSHKDPNRISMDESARRIGVDPNDFEAYNNRGLAYCDKEEYDKAITDYTKAIELNPKLANAYNNRGLVYFIRVEYDRAIGDYNEAIELDPKLAEAYRNRGNAYDARGEYDKAKADKKKAKELGVKKT